MAPPRFLHSCVATSLSLLLVLTAIGAHADDPLPTSVFRNLQAGKKQTVIVYGTSLTHGGAWTEATKQWFDTRFPGQVTFINSGGPGQNSDWGLANLKAKVLDHQPDLVFIEFSFNDAHEKFALPVERGAENLDKIVRGIRAQNAETAIVLQIMNAAWDAPNGKRSLSSRPQLDAFNDNYRRYAREHNLPLIDHFPAWQQLKETDPDRFHGLLPDGTHPTREGSLEMTWPAIQELLEKSRSVVQ